MIKEHRGKLNRNLLDPEKLPTVPDTFKLDKYKCESEDGSSGDESDDSSSGNRPVDLEHLYDWT